MMWMTNSMVADEDLLLALLNTTPVVDGEPTDVLADAGAAAEWIAARAGRPDAGAGSPRASISPATADLRDLRDLRDELQHVVRGELGAEHVNTRLADVKLVPAIDSSGAVRWRLDDTSGDASGTANGVVGRALLGWLAVVEKGPSRLRACANDECHLFLLDRSKSNTARWCSMATCGNRLKARRHQARLQAAPHAPAVAAS
ncbi:CGNR zinc finger domain-containing protein [Subtercola endophyticus]|uniref:CGNR zinc finger domain-containing protein n=1 Tax=Subtercola endophyticus TaxID=2895559 RepID=UPI001E5C1A50|nr:CGNR zinc finger domain-containing protein [Subtercola endophyticus]UFS59195.1 CGNR zinc finger domain-containing protein [Subtercola endophyticus]